MDWSVNSDDGVMPNGAWGFYGRMLLSSPWLPCARLLQDHDGESLTSEQLGDGGVPVSSVPPPPPPPLPQPAAEDAVHALMAPRSPYITSGEEPVSTTVQNG